MCDRDVFKLNKCVGEVFIKNINKIVSQNRFKTVLYILKIKIIMKILMKIKFLFIIILFD